jgi:hypothetical protein
MDKQTLFLAAGVGILVAVTTVVVTKLLGIGEYGHIIAGSAAGVASVLLVGCRRRARCETGESSS